MARKSSIETLPRDVRDAIEAALEGGATIDDIKAKLDELGHERSRSAVGRFAQDFAEITRKRRVMRDAMAPFHEAAKGDAAGGVIVQLMESIVTRALMPIALEADEEGGVSALELSRLANAARSVVSTKIASQREIRAAEDAARERTKADAAAAAETEARSAGASEATIARIRARILGLDEAA